jgi:uncharacterized glyoxalase superfamily protein PhnB
MASFGAHRAVPVLAVIDIAAAISEFHDLLHWDEEFLWGDPPTYAAVRLGGAVVHLRAEPERAAVTVAVDLDNVDRYAEAVEARGANVQVPLADRDYGMRDFTVTTVDGHRLVFGSPC